MNTSFQKTVVKRAIKVTALMAVVGWLVVPANSFGQSDDSQQPLQAEPVIEQTIVEIVAGDDQLKTLAEVLQAAELGDTLSQEGPYTLLAPTEYAFSKLPSQTRQSLLNPENRAQLKSILMYHVLPGKVMATDVIGLTQAKTTDGAELAIDVDSSGIRINDARVGLTNIRASNGVIHRIDTLLIPSGATPQQTTTSKPNEGLDGAAGDATDSAMEETSSKDIVETASAAGQFTKLLTAIQVAGLDEALKGDGPYTVFAPTDTAFANLPVGILEGLMAEENRTQLQNFLMSHIVKGNFSSKQIAGQGDEVQSASGEPLQISSGDGKLMINQSEVTAADIPCKNGTIHVINRVLLTE